MTDKTNVVELRPNQPKPGGLTFFVCGCAPEAPHPFVPIVLYQSPPVVVGLVCTACRLHLVLVDGVVQPLTKS